MLPAAASAPAPDPAALHAAYLGHLQRTGRGNTAYWTAARTFFARWPDPAAWTAEPLHVRLSANGATRPLITFLMLHGHLQPGYDYLLERKFSSVWRELAACPAGPDLTRFLDAAAELGFSERHRTATASQVPARLLVQTGRRLDQLTTADLEEFAAACQARQERSGKGWWHYRMALQHTRRVLFHLQILDRLPELAGPRGLADRLAGITPPVRDALIAYLELKKATCTPRTVSSLATRLMHFGRFLTLADPGLSTLSGLDRRRHIEPYLAFLAGAPNSKKDAVITIGEQQRRILAVGNFLTDITEWGWDDAPSRRLIFRGDAPRLPRVLPRYLPVDADRRLAAALRQPGNELAAAALLLQRACGLRIGELLDLELDCVHEVPGSGAWLKVPLGKLDTERMVPLDSETVDLVDQITAIRSPGRPLPHPRYGRPAQFLFTHHGRRLSQNAVREELDRAGHAAGLGHVTSHQLRHTYATALVNAGVSLQALMALLGHVSAEMSLRYGRLFDATVRTEYERALTLAKQRLGTLPEGRTALPLAGIANSATWKDSPVIKSRLAGGFCLRAPAQGACAYANICEHCPNFRTDATYLPVLAAQRTDAEALAEDAEARGWITEATRHRDLLARLDTLISKAQAG
ncbi:MAG: tyrosine-type recombinase/integrase [Streptosporangiaceae bacterium]